MIRDFGPLSIHHLKLVRDEDQVVYLERWGIALCDTELGGIYLHRMRGPDPGPDLHDHPWPFWSFRLWGGYVEQRSVSHVAVTQARMATRLRNVWIRGWCHRRGWLTGTFMPMEACHRIVELTRPTVWTLVVRGPRTRSWGFYTADGFINHREYDGHLGSSRPISEYR